MSQELNSFLSTNAKIIGEFLGRMNLASRLGMQYAGDRDLYKALGYPDIGELQFSDYYGRYLRQDIAKAVIDRPVRATWQGPIELIEAELTEDTAFENAWYDLEKKHSLKAKLSRLDRLTGIGQYGVLLFGFDDVQSKEGLKIPVKAGTRKLLYIRPFSEGSAVIKTFEENPSNERYGMPLIYEIVGNDLQKNSEVAIEVHYSRVLHIIDSPLESEIYGLPRLQGIYNRLMDLDKVIGGDAEMFWRGARPGFEGKVDPNYTMTDSMREDLKDQIAEYENNLRRILINEGVELRALEQQISDPESHVNVILKAISAETGIPLRVLTGSERGELASTQDASGWKEYILARREDHAEPYILRPFVDVLLKYGILPNPKSGDFVVKWSDPFAMSEKERVDIGKARANALREYTYSPMAEAIMPPEAFFDLCLGLSTDQITLVRKQREEMIKDEELYQKIIDALDNDPNEGVQEGENPVNPTETPTPENPKNKMGS